VSVIERASFADPWSASDFREALGAGILFFVSVSSERVDGYVVARLAADEGEILNLAVAPQGRRQGVGRALARDALEALRARGAAAVYLEVRESNTAARWLYEGLGFQSVGRRVRYYRHPTEDAVVLRAAISAVTGDAIL
jgi:ribosomal-protein-alanine N-acetyltransferase